MNPEIHFSPGPYKGEAQQLATPTQRIDQHRLRGGVEIGLKIMSGH